MRVAIIGRTEILYDTAVQLRSAGHEIVCILTAKEAPEYKRGAEDFRLLAEKWMVPFVCSVRILEQRDFLAQAKADIAVSINFSGVIPGSVTDLFPLGILNAHGGDLPRYRGNACQAWAILNGEKKIGLCIHRMIGDELDSGDIIARDYCPIDIETTIGDTLNWIERVTPDLFVHALSKLQLDPGFILESQPKDHTLALRCYPRLPNDARIDWHKSAFDIIRLVNASGRPYAGAFCFFEERKLTIWEAKIGDDERFLAMPGQVTAINSNYLEVATGEGKVRLMKLSYDGKLVLPYEVCKSIRCRLS
jgi:methionyl-tRNA formyltransferase